MLDWPAQITELSHIPTPSGWVELPVRPYRQTSALDLTNALMTEGEKIPAARFHTLVIIST